MFNHFFKFSLLLISALLITSCGDDEEPTITPPPMNQEEFVIYDGADITFTKEDDTDETLESNQDRINDDVWITRGTDGGEIFNIRTESVSSKGNSPAGTEWSLGTTANISGLTFGSFRDAVNPQDVVGKSLVLHLIEEDAYLDIEFSSWTQGKAGGFSYTRSTK